MPGAEGADREREESHPLLLQPHLVVPITGKKRAQVWKKLKKIVKAVELGNFGTGTLELVEFWNLITSWNSGYQPGTPELDTNSELWNAFWNLELLELWNLVPSRNSG